MITKEKLYAAAMVTLGLAAIYFFSRSLGTIFVSTCCLAAGWYLKGRFGEKAKEIIDNVKK